MSRDYHLYTKKEDRIIMQNVSENIGNLHDAFRISAKRLSLSAESVRKHYYKILKPRMAKMSSLRKLLYSRGFFMLSKSRLYMNGKNSANALYKPHWVKKETVDRLIDNL